MTGSYWFFHCLLLFFVLCKFPFGDKSWECHSMPFLWALWDVTSNLRAFFEHGEWLDWVQLWASSCQGVIPSYWSSSRAYNNFSISERRRPFQRYAKCNFLKEFAWNSLWQYGVSYGLNSVWERKLINGLFVSWIFSLLCRGGFTRMRVQTSLYAFYFDWEDGK